MREQVIGLVGAAVKSADGECGKYLKVKLVCSAAGNFLAARVKKKKGKALRMIAAAVCEASGCKKRKGALQEQQDRLCFAKNAPRLWCAQKSAKSARGVPLDSQTFFEKGISNSKNFFGVLCVVRRFALALLGFG